MGSYPFFFCRKADQTAAQKGDILLHGHTHLPVWEPFGQDNYYLNPGSASLPKDGNPHSYLVWENQTFTWKDMDGKAFHELTL